MAPASPAEPAPCPRPGFGRALATFAAVVALARLLLLWPPARDTGLVAATLFAWTPCLLVLAGTVDVGLLGLGLRLDRRVAGALGLAALALALYVPYCLLVVRRFAPYGPTSPPDLGLAALAAALALQIVAVALPEELFFRGLLQGWMRDGGRREAAAALGSALLFALAHPALGGGARSLEVAVPGLLFAWLRLRTGSIWPSVAAHGAANVLHRALLALPL